MNPVRRAEYLRAMPRIRGRQSLRRIAELQAASPYTDEKASSRLLQEFRNEAGHTVTREKPSEKQHLLNLLQMGVQVEIIPPDAPESAD